jgi:hypothetical protein
MQLFRKRNEAGFSIILWAMIWKGNWPSSYVANEEI